MNNNRFTIGQRVAVPGQTIVGVSVGGKGFGTVMAIDHWDAGGSQTEIVCVEIDDGDVHEHFGSMLQEA